MFNCLFYYNSDLRIYTVVKQALPTLHGVPLGITRTVSLKKRGGGSNPTVSDQVDFQICL